MRKIGMNRGKRRIWLEGSELTQHGINHGMRYDIATGINWLRIIINPEGKRKIAGKPNRPIIDMTGRTVEAAFHPDVEHFEIVKTDTGIALKAVEA